MKKSNILFLMLTLLLISCFNEKTKENTIVDLPNDHTKESPKDIGITKLFVLGKFNYQNDTSFVIVDKIHSSKTIYIKRETYKAFLRMFDRAKENNINLKIISGTRNFNQQKSIWDRKWEKYDTIPPFERAKKILEYSSMPSTSRHHWGTDIDIYNLNNSYFETGQGKKEYEWLLENANKFGFYEMYTEKNKTGYKAEKWHWSYLPLANKYLDYYNKKISYKDIKGFKGAEFAEKIHIIEDFVNIR